MNTEELENQIKVVTECMQGPFLGALHEKYLPNQCCQIFENLITR